PHATDTDAVLAPVPDGVHPIGAHAALHLGPPDGADLVAAGGARGGFHRHGARLPRAAAAAAVRTSGAAVLRVVLRHPAREWPRHRLANVRGAPAAGEFFS